MSRARKTVGTIVVMGVSGAGKSTVARALAERCGRPFLEGDDFHPVTNIRKMAGGQPLDESDREPWLRSLAEAIANELRAGRSPIVACSALSAASRSALRTADSALMFVYLTAQRSVIEARMRARSGHFMPASLLDSQWAALEPPTDALRIDASLPVTTIVEQILTTTPRVTTS